MERIYERVKKGIGPYASIALVILISALFPLIMFQILEKQEIPETKDEIPRTHGKVGVLFEIDAINGNTVYIKNIGLYSVEDLKFYIENREINHTGPFGVRPGGIEAFVLNVDQLKNFPYPNTLTAASSGILKSREVDFSGLS